MRRDEAVIFAMLENVMTTRNEAIMQLREGDAADFLDLISLVQSSLCSPSNTCAHVDTSDSSQRIVSVTIPWRISVI